MFKPLLAAKMPKDESVEDVVKNLLYPLYASPKLDGIRVIVRDSKVYTRKLKLLPNRFVQDQLGTTLYEGLDGEIMTADSTDAQAFRKTTSGVMSRAGEPNFVFHVFDDLTQQDKPFSQRYSSLTKRLSAEGRVRVVEHVFVTNASQLIRYEEEMLKQGYEGVMIRRPDGGYKFGRSTWREGILRKLTRTIREEARIVGYEERMHNANEAKRDELGKMKRSSHKANLSGRGDLGALIVESSSYGKPFSIGTGFDDDERAKLWKRRESLIGKQVTFEHRPYGDYDVPRFPTFIGIRHD